MNSDLLAQLDALARVPILLVATDFDGTIAPIVSDPAKAEADREAIVALKSLATMPQTHVAIVSGRSLIDLGSRTHELEDAHLVGSHGSEYEAGFPTALTPDAESLLKRLMEFVHDIITKNLGLLLESKPAAFALHYRNVDAVTSKAVVDAVLRGPASWPGMHIRHGKQVIELGVVETNKGAALRRIRQRAGATAVVFIGDDLTDEDAFATLGGPDLGIKVGPGESIARERASGTLDVALILAKLSERRSEWLAGSIVFIQE